MKRISIGLEVKAAFFAFIVAAFAIGGVLGAAALMRVTIQNSREAASNAGSPPIQSPIVAKGAKLYALNCSHCHADDATGDEGPDLHGLTHSDERIKAIVTNGIKGEMPSFKKKLGEEDKEALVGFLRSLR